MITYLCWLFRQQKTQQCYIKDPLFIFLLYSCLAFDWFCLLLLLLVAVFEVFLLGFYIKSVLKIARNKILETGVNFNCSRIYYVSLYIITICFLIWNGSPLSHIQNTHASFPSSIHYNPNQQTGSRQGISKTTSQIDPCIALHIDHMFSLLHTVQPSFWSSRSHILNTLVNIITFSYAWERGLGRDFFIFGRRVFALTFELLKELQGILFTLNLLTFIAAYWTIR